MKIRTLLKSLAIGAGLFIFAVGLVIARTAPPQVVAQGVSSPEMPDRGPDHRAMREYTIRP